MAAMKLVCVSLYKTAIELSNPSFINLGEQVYINLLEQK